MDSRNYYPKYEALFEKACGNWYVAITLKDGSVEKYYGFVSERHARAWAQKETPTRDRNEAFARVA
jgi:hypothetical protein